MRRSDLQLEENYNEFLRLLQDDDYLEVTHDEESGGVSAIHILHKFDKQSGPYGVRRGDYEMKVVKVLRELGHRIVLEAEPSLGEKKAVLYFPEEGLYSSFRVSEGVRLFGSSPDISKESELTRILVIVNDELVACWDKETTPIEGWSVWEGLRRQNGANPFTISPSDAKV